MALIFPTTLSILTNTFQGPERARAIGIWAGVSGVGIVVGPLGGGLLLEHFDWGSVFLVNVPICIAAIVLGHFFVPTSRDPEEGRLDPVGAVLSILAERAALRHHRGPVGRVDLDRVVTALVAGAVFLALFGFWETHSSHPMLDIRFFRNPRFSAASATITSPLHAVRVHVPAHAVLPVRARLLTARVRPHDRSGGGGDHGRRAQARKLAERFGTKRAVVGGLFLVAAALSMYAPDTIMSQPVLGGTVRAVRSRGLDLRAGDESIMGRSRPASPGSAPR